MGRKAYYELDPDDQSYVRELRKRYGGSKVTYRRTVDECCARVLLRHPDKSQRIETLLLDEMDREIEKSESRSCAVSRKLSTYEDDGRLTIYKGAVTTSLLSVCGEAESASEIDSLEWNEDSMLAVRNIKWHDVLKLSAIYNLIDRNSMQGVSHEGYPNSVNVTSNQVWHLMFPRLDSVPETWADDLNDTIARFQRLSGKYTRHLKSSDVAFDRTYYINSEGKFLFGEEFDRFRDRNEDGNYSAYFGLSQYKTICEKQGRIESIAQKALEGKTMEDCYVLSYLAYRHNFTHVRNKSIRLDTLTNVVGLGRSLNDRREIRGWLRSLDGMLVNGRVEKDSGGHWRILWD